MLQIHGNLVILHGITEEGGVGKAGGLSHNQVVGVLHDDGVLAVEDQVIGRLAGGLAAADEEHLVAHGHLVLQQLGEGEALVKAGHGGHGPGHGAGGHDDIVKAPEGAKVGDFGVEVDFNAGLLYLSLVPAQQLLVVLLEAHGRGGEEQTAQLVGLFKDDGLVSSLVQHQGALHTADAAADDGHFLGLLGGDYLVAVVLHGGGVQSAAGQVQRVIQLLLVGSALPLGEVEAAVVAADAGLDLVLAALHDLVDPLVVDKVLTGYCHGIYGAGGYLFRSHHRVHTAGADHGLVGEFLYVLYILQVAVVRHVLWGMSPVPGVVGAVVAVEHIVSGVAQILDGPLGLLHVAAPLLKVRLIRHGALAPLLGLGDHGITQGDGEVGSGFSLDGLDYLHREAEAVLEGAAVLVGTVVPVLHGELVEQVAFMDGMYLNAVDPGLSQTLGGLTEGFHHLLDLGHGERTGLHVLSPAVGGGGGGGAAVLHVHYGAGQLVEYIVLGQNGHPAVDGHGAAHAGGQLDEQLCPGLVELHHVLLQLLEHLVILIQPLSAGNAQLVPDTLHAGQDETYTVLGPVEQEVCRFFIEVVWLQPTEQGSAAHGALDYAVLYFHIADFPGCK